MNKIVITAMTILVSLLLITCQQPTHAPKKDAGPIEVSITAVSLDTTGFPLEVGATRTVKATALPANTTEAVTWSSSDATKATVSQAGVVTGVAAGSVNIIASSPSDGNIKAVAAVNVVAVGSLSALDAQFTFFNQAGVNSDSTQVLPNLVNNILTLANTNGDSLVKATVEKNTMVIFKTPMTGEFKFRARVKMSSRVLSSADRGVTVAAYAKTGGDFGTSPPMAGFMYRARGDVRSYYHTGSAYSAGSPNVVNDTSNTFDVERILEVKRTSLGYTFSLFIPKTGALDVTSDLVAASLNSALTGSSPVYLALTVGGVTADFANIEIYDSLAVDAVAVYQSPVAPASPVPLKGISITGPSNNADATYEYQNSFPAMSTPRELQLSVVASPSSADNTSVVWESSAPSVATVSSTGLVTVLTAGIASITATSNDGGFLASYDINISASANPVTGITVTGPSSLMAGLQAYLGATIAPSNATIPTVTWSSGTPAFATVDATTGVVTALSAGTTVITATATDGSGVTGTLSLTVTAYSAAIWSWSSTTTATTLLYDVAATPMYPTINGKTLVGRSSSTVLSLTNPTGMVLANNRFVIGSAYYDVAPGGATAGPTTGSYNPPDGQFNFTKKAKLTIGYSTASVGTSNGLTVYLNNNVTSDSATTSMLFSAAPSISSKLYETGQNAAPGVQAPIIAAGTPGTISYVIDPAVFTQHPETLAKAFLQIRTGSAGTITITGLTVEYID